VRASEKPSGSGGEAFDAIASRYDTLFAPAVNPLIPIMRERVYGAIARHFPPGSTLLELGCGTGEDTLALVQRGYRIVAADPAPQMLAEAERKIAEGGARASVTFVRGGASALAEEWPSAGLTVDGVFSNFAPLNCELSLDPVRLLLEQALRPGRRFIGVVLPRLCPMEVALFLGRLDPRSALRRFRRRPEADVEGRRFEMRYYGARDFDRALAGGFQRVETRSLGLVLPPLSFGPAFGRVPGLLPALAALEDRVSGLPGLRRMGDHVLLAYERR
jgi:SAM-dependent methyltransferase